MQCKSDGSMEGLVTEKKKSYIIDTDDVKNSESAENFQKFMYELFEKNGVINDLRAYLRGHIVEVLKSAQNGDIPACQKHFTQRLELPFQAWNILIAEYLLKLEFNYTVSVFLSEIPLANMVFAFAKGLMKGSCDAGMKFKDEDVWSIFNYLGIKCDSDHASNVVEMYREKNNSPLLLCILKCIPMYKEPIDIEQDSSLESLSSSVNSSENLDDKTRRQSSSLHDKCKHFVFCKTCQNKMRQIKEKYRKKKNNLLKNLTKSSVKLKNVEYLMKNIDVLEKSLIDEMFQQLKSVYESEIEMMKNQEDKRVKRSLVTHAMQLQKKRNEMEESFKTRSAELEFAVQQKKRFLWGLARALREQHANLASAMRDVQEETSRLFDKEESLKTQLAEAEQILRQRGEDMRNQISNELVILEGHLESMKRERDSINKERSELENIKLLCNSAFKTNMETHNEELRSHYDLIKNELVILKKYLETTKLEPKCVIERSTMTELADVSTKIDVVLNNGHGMERRSEDKIKAKQLVNDLKRRKNVNYKSNELQLSHVRSITSGTSETDPDALQLQREENERLRIFARQQREHIDELSSQQARLQAELTAARAPRAAAVTLRPRTAPATMPDDNFLAHRINASASSNNLSHSWRKGAGEELSFFANAQPRIVVPGDTLPFIGVIRDRHTDNRRYLINQWRSLRRRVSPSGGVGKQGARERSARERANSAGPSFRVPSEEEQNNNENEPTDDCHFRASREPSPTVTNNSRRDRSPKTALKETKDEIKTKDNTNSPLVKRRTPVLREAKLRLRKLEIEAEAVEKSYLDFRRQQGALRGERNGTSDAGGIGNEPEKDLKPIERSAPKSNEKVPIKATSHHNKPMPSLTVDFDKYIKEYHAKYDLSEALCKNNNASSVKVKPIPTAYSDTASNTGIMNKNYLETPLEEFRKYYQSEKRAAESTLKSRSRTIFTNFDNRESNNSPTSVHSELCDDQNELKSSVAENLENSDMNIPHSPKIMNFKDINAVKFPLAKNDNSDSNSPKPPLIVKFEDENAHAPLPKNVDNSENNNIKSPIIMKFDVNAAKSPLSQNINICEDRYPMLITSRSFDGRKAAITAKSKNRDNFVNNGSSKDLATLGSASSQSAVKGPETKLTSKLIRNEMIRHAQELEILKKNISKIYNLPEKCMADNVNHGSCNEICRDEKLNKINNVTDLLDELIEEVSVIDPDNKSTEIEKNLLRIELQNASELSNVKICDSPTEDFMLVVESSIAVGNGDSEQNNERDDTSVQMTIIVSPNRTNLAGAASNGNEVTNIIEKPCDDFGEKSIRMVQTDNDSVNAIYQAEPIDIISSVQMQLELSKDALDHNSSELGELEVNEAQDDYPDDFSADVDNFNSKLDIQYDTDHSPISMAKTSEEESFWDS